MRANLYSLANDRGPSVRTLSWRGLQGLQDGEVVLFQEHGSTVPLLQM